MSMILGIHSMSIIVSAIFSIAVANVWYSSLIFGPLLIDVANLSNDDLKFLEKHPFTITAIALMMSSVLYMVIASLILRARLSDTPLIELCLVLILFVTPLIMGIVLWKRKPFSHALIHIGYSGLVIWSGVGIMAYWPW